MKIKLYNKISHKGLELFDENKYEFKENLENEDGILVRSAKLHDIELHENLKAIIRAGAGVNNIPIDKCSKQGIVVFNTPGANANAVKELVIAGMLLSSRPIHTAMNWVNTLKNEDDVFNIVENEKSRFIGSELRGKKIGVIGLGAIGIKVANLALHFGMEVYGYDPYISINAAWNLSAKIHYAKTLDEIYDKCDYITLHVPLVEKTKNLINEKAIQKMKKEVCILNFSRNEIVDEVEICKALENNAIKNYVSDFPNSTILNKKGVIAIPHLGASTPESEDNCAIMAVEQMCDFLENGNITNAINMPNVVLDRSGVQRICVFHKNEPNMLATISQVISSKELNIENLINKSKDNYAYTIIDVNNKADETVLNNLKNNSAILKVTVID